MISERLHIYWECDARQHLALVAAFIIFCVIITTAYYFNEERSKAAEFARTWKKVEAKVISSKISEVSTSDENSFSTRLTASAKFGYRTDGKMTYGNYVGSWTRSDLSNWSELLRPGNSITIRVSPDDFRVVSLVDHNGIK